MKRDFRFSRRLAVALAGSCLGAALAFSLGAGNGLAGTVPDVSRLVKVPDPLAGDNPPYPLVPVEVPEIGATFSDVHFGTDITRVTGRGKIRQEYSRFDPFNADGSMILLLSIDEGWFRAYGTDSVPYEDNLVREIDLSEPRWDPADPRLLWGLRDFSILTVNVQTGEETLVKDFAAEPSIAQILAQEADLYRITMKDEGEASMDNRYWAFFLQGSEDDYRMRYILTWDRQEDALEGLYKISPDEDALDWIGMSPLGGYVLIGGMEYNGGNLTGLTMADRKLTRFHRLDYTTAHSDVGLDTDGKEVVVMQSTRTDCVDLIPIDWSTQPILESGGSYAGTHRTPLARLYYHSESPYNFDSGIHLSCNCPGYCVVGTTSRADNQEKNWLDRSHVLVKLDPEAPEAWYLAKVYNSEEQYWEETHATLSRDGSKVVWASNWNRNVGEEEVFVLRLDLPVRSDLPPVVVDSEEAEVQASFQTGQAVDLSCKAEAGAKMWVLVEAPSLYPGAKFARPRDEYCSERGRWVFPFAEGAADLYYAESFQGSRIAFGVNDFSGAGTVVVTTLQGDSPEDLRTVQTIRLVEGG